MSRTLARLLQAPSVILLLFWMLVPLSFTIFFSLIRYQLVSLRRPEWTQPDIGNWRGLGNYEYVLNNPKFFEFNFGAFSFFHPASENFLNFWVLNFFGESAVGNTIFMVGSILILTVVLGLAIAVLLNRVFPGRGIARVMVISPFFIMPAVNAVLVVSLFLKKQ